MKKATCPTCKKEYSMGYDGTVDGCDKCQGIIRDGNDYAWKPGENEHNYKDVATGRVYTVTRKEAFSR
jgi:hypothetical protein